MNIYLQMLQVQYETDETVVSGEERRGGPYKTATIIGYGDQIKLGILPQ